MRCGEGAVPEGALEGGRILDAAALGQALRHLLARTEVTTTRALIAASDMIASFRVLTIPRDATDAEIDAEVRGQLPLGSSRMALRHIEVLKGRGQRTLYATVWDRGQVQLIADTARHAGLEPVVVDLKSLCVARAVPLGSCVVLDLSGEPYEAVLIDERVPRVWHTFKVQSSGDVAASLATGLKPVLGFYRTSGSATFGSDSPILIRADQQLPSQVIVRLQQLTGHPIDPLPQPHRIKPEVRFGSFLTCIGLVMRRLV
jgi:hypothetical protein